MVDFLQSNYYLLYSYLLRYTNDKDITIAQNVVQHSELSSTLAIKYVAV